MRNQLSIGMSRRGFLAGTAALAGGAAALALPAATANAVERMVSYSFQAQPNYYYCSAASAHMALTARGVNVAQSTLANYMGVTPSEGLPNLNNLRNAMNHYTNTSYYQTKQWGSQSEYNARLDADVVYNVDRGHAVLLNVHYYHHGGVPYYTDGHYLIVVGYDTVANTYWIADPADSQSNRALWYSKAKVQSWQKLYRYVA